MAKSTTQNPNHTTLDGNDVLDKYVIDHSDPEPEYLYRLWRATNVFMLHGRMASGRLQGRLLKMLVQMAQPRNIIEVGTFSGYSALCMAEGLAENEELRMKNEECNLRTEGNSDSSLFTLHSSLSDSSLSDSSLFTLHSSLSDSSLSDSSLFTLHSSLSDSSLNLPHLYTFEINDEQEPFTRKWIEGSPWADYVTFIIGDAAVEAPRLGKTFDMAFLDGDKKTYVETYEALMPLMNPGAFILADNTLWDGHVTDPDYDRDKQTQGIRRFNDHVANDPRVTRVILPLRDGLTLIRKNRG